jgi:hypothetical protein
LVFYTDGLIDVGRPGAEDHLSQLARSMESPSLGCEDLADAILSDQFDSEGGRDDIALLVVEWKVASTSTSVRVPEGARATRPDLVE